MNYKNKNKMAKLVRVIRADYWGPDYAWKIPKDLPLLSQEDNEKVCSDQYWKPSVVVPFSWWIIYTTFYYYDKDGQVQTIEQSNACEPNLKHPNDVSDEKEEDSEQEDSEEEEEDK